MNLFQKFAQLPFNVKFAFICLFLVWCLIAVVASPSFTISLTSAVAVVYSCIVLVDYFLIQK